MKNKYQKTAKDIAHEKQIQKLKTDICKEREKYLIEKQENEKLNKLIADKDLEILKLQSLVNSLKKLTNLPAEQINEYVITYIEEAKRNKKQQEAIQMLNTIMKSYGS